MNTMSALFLEALGDYDHFVVVRFLIEECNMPFSDAKMLLIGKRLRVLTGGLARLVEVRDKLAELGARAVIDFNYCLEEDEECL